MTGYGQHSSEAEVRAGYDEAKQKALNVSRGPLGRIAVLALWIGRQQSIRRLRKMDRRG